MTRIYSIILICLLSFQSTAQRVKPVQIPRLIDGAQLLSDLKTLSADDMEGRKPGALGGLKARAYIVNRFKQSGIVPFNDSYLQPFGSKSGENKAEHPYANVIGFIKGAKQPSRYIVLTAHYDHLGIKGGKIYNGADDNASGVAALFALAAYFNQNPPAHTLIFAALDMEESGHVGAKTFLATPPVDKQAMVMNVNLDMICRDEQNKLYAVGTYHYPFLKTYLEKLIASPPVTLLLGHDQGGGSEEDWTRDSDHYQFHREKIPFIYFGVEDYKQHHQATDDYETITPEFYTGAVETILSAVKVFDANLAAIEKARAQK